MTRQNAVCEKLKFLVTLCPVRFYLLSQLVYGLVLLCLVLYHVVPTVVLFEDGDNRGNDSRKGYDCLPCDSHIFILTRYELLRPL